MNLLLRNDFFLRFLLIGFLNFRILDLFRLFFFSSLLFFWGLFRLLIEF